ncbi:MAG TPA: LamG-like jellyroll fold domain-containing protein [Rugosimonospora sp.]|nr:LamG-like jellyroll fold domain-containing protein [Rugosimonospora sp.]
MVDHSWTPLDATLQANPDGTVSPKVATGSLTLSGGGTGPMATMRAVNRSLAVSLPFTLPTPTLSGATATFPAVLPGVDLQITADRYGGFSDVLVVRDAAAAANPAVQSLTMTVHTTGLSIVADAAGNLSARDPGGLTVFSAPTPHMWDSAAPSGPVTTVTDPATGQQVDTATSMPVQSGPAGPGEAAHRADISVATSGTTLTLTPSASVLSGPNVTWPVYLDPGWSNGKSGWASVSEYYPSTNYWDKTPDPEGEMQVGNSGSMWSHTLVNFLVSSLSGATIQSAQLNLTEVWSYSCTASTVDVYAPSTTLSSSNATWNSWAGISLGSVAASANVAHGYSSSCPSAGVGFNVRSAVQNAASAGRGTQTFVLTGVNESSDHNSWKEFDPASANLSVTYDHAPQTPTGLSTSPMTACNGNPTPTTVGDANVTLYTPVYDQDGGNLTTTVQLRVGSTTGTVVDNTTLTYPSGSSAVRVVPEATLRTASGGSSAVITQFYWQAQVSDGTLSSGWSTFCTFKFDPNRPGQPDVPPPASATMGQPVSITVTKPASGDTPVSYLYQLNAAAVASIAADANGNATITVTPNRFTNVLTVNSVSAGGNLSLDAGRAVFIATPPATPQADGDLTGDNIPDLLTTGTSAGIPAGLWLAQGQASAGHTTGTGQLVPAVSDIGANGNGTTGSHGNADFTGAQAITGHFSSNSNGNLQDILAYNPSTGTGAILAGNGDGSVLTPSASNSWEITTGTFSDANYADGSYGPGDNPRQIVNAGNAAGTGSYPDLIGINGDDTNGYYLAYYDNLGGVDEYIPDVLAANTPDGSSWKDWTLASVQVNGQTDLFLWRKATGALYLWTNLTNHSPGGGDLTYTPSTLYASGWNTNATLSLQAADINGDGTPDLYAVAPGGVVIIYLMSLVSSPPATAQTSQTLVTSNHTWLLNDAASGTVSAADATGSLPATGTSGASWNTGDVFSPDVEFDGSTGAVATNTAAVHTNADFTVSAWVKPNTSGGTVLSQDGPHNAGFVLYPDTTTGQWTFGMTTSDSNTAYQYARNQAGPVTLGVWAHVTATYKASSGTMALYVDGNPAGTYTHTSPWDATGKLQIGTHRANDAYTGYFNGQIADVQTWNQTLTPAQVADLSGTPGYIMFQTDNTSYTTGANWTSRCGKMNFNAGQLSITMTCAKAGTVSFGATGHSTAILTLQGDGNLVIYPTPTHANALWSSSSYGYPGDTMFFQNDGNLVIYDTDGSVIWASGTWNYLNGSALYAHADNQYVCADNTGANPLIANRASAGVWETFDVINLGNGNIALRSHANGLFVTAENAGAKPLIANRTAVGLWETFQLIHNTDGSISLKSAINGDYVTADNAGANPLIANRTAIGPWEEFDLLGGQP